ncbi:polyamine aminopropyltransferase [Pseudomonas nitroreducens]|uniref:Polyamine aminopropyltransferase n=1 Tax=Pseudomonas nitroreducens TaxID=46680 RepID=A0A5R9A696_PSENT|nr:polyamine aminopropyltransferase [Pseudomonas nitroreducens]TLP73565.1 polyamine aminopropyltransferase [Pseudomonas nitroreducens]
MGEFRESLHDGYAQALSVDEPIYQGNTGQQEVQVFRNRRFGRVLTLDGVVQTTEADEFVYHEMLAHVPILAHGAVRRVLVIGVGDGGILREIVRHAGIEEIIAVEIDPQVVELCRELLPLHSAGALDDPRLQLIYADGLEHLAQSRETFDLILCDSTDPGGPAASLFTDAFYRNCQQRLGSGGILATQNGVPFLQPEELGGTARRLADNFADWGFFHAAVPTYIGGSMAFGWASNSEKVRRTELETLRQRFAKSGLVTRYYTPEVHQAAFALPRYMLDLIEAGLQRDS